MTMDVETPDPPATDHPGPDLERDDIITFLTQNNEICFKNQQKWEPDLTTKEKSDIALDIFSTSKLNFLVKFGRHLKQSQLGYFNRFTLNSEPDWEEIKVLLNELRRNCSENSNQKTIRNRRFEAMKQMVEENSYFSDIEMMKRNPLLYEQLVGRYLSNEEVRERDKYRMDEQCTFVKILMEGIERDNAEAVRKKQEADEDDQMEEEDSSSDEEDMQSSTPAPSTSRWGEFEEDKMRLARVRPRKDTNITAEERHLLKEEFISTMYQNFLDGKDQDFDYETVDNDASFDNLNEIGHDEEDKYFAEEEANDEDIDRVSSEDELDIYMNALTQHPAVSELSKEMKKL